MEIQEFNLVVLLQRVIELLAFYLVLANMNGKGLEKAFKDFFTDGQRRFHGNVVAFIGYVLVMTVVISNWRELGHTITQITTPFVGLFLVRKADIRQGLLGFVFLGLLGGVVVIPRVFFTYHTLISFGILLVMTIWLVSRHQVYKMYEHLVSKKLWLHLVSFISLIIYGLPFVFNTERLLFLSLMVGFFLLSNLFLLKSLAQKSMERKLSEAVDLIANSSYDELLLFLEEISYDHAHSEYLHHFVINNKTLAPKFADALSGKLEKFKESAIIKDYRCRTINEQIKISVIL